jgi:hypothetical protein
MGGRVVQTYFIEANEGLTQPLQTWLAAADYCLSSRPLLRLVAPEGGFHSEGSKSHMAGGSRDGGSLSGLLCIAQ